MRFQTNGHMTHQNGTAKVLPHGIDPRDLEGAPERISADPSPPTHHERVGSEAPIDAHVTNFVARTATLNSRWSALNWTCALTRPQQASLR